MYKIDRVVSLHWLPGLVCTMTVVLVSQPPNNEEVNKCKTFSTIFAIDLWDSNSHQSASETPSFLLPLQRAESERSEIDCPNGLLWKTTHDLHSGGPPNGKEGKHQVLRRLEISKTINVVPFASTKWFSFDAVMRRWPRKAKGNQQILRK
jgi:hypothetical protein